MKELAAYLKRSQRGALSRMAEAVGCNAGSLCKWAKGEWKASDRVQKRIRDAMATIRVFSRKTGPTKNNAGAAPLSARMFNAAEIVRFHSNVHATGADTCWKWKAHKNRAGYGTIRLGGGLHLAHRVAFAIHKSDIPAHILVCHRCDNPRCVNPAHLFLGTSADNSADAARKSRMPHGVKHHKAKLTEQAVASILRRHHARESTCAELAREFGVSYAAIHAVIKRRTWTHVSAKSRGR